MPVGWVFIYFRITYTNFGTRRRESLLWITIPQPIKPQQNPRYIVYLLMSDISQVDPALHTENGRRLHATLRAVLSLGIWLVLAMQLMLIFSLNWRAMVATSPGASLLVILLTTAILTLFLYLQAGAFYALTLNRQTLSVRDIVRAGKPIFADFIWLTLKAGLLLLLVLNGLIYLALLTTGHDIKALINALSPFFSLMAAVPAFAFVYWLPYVFVHREFRLFPSFGLGLKLAWARLGRSGFLALLIFVPTIISGLLPAESPLFLDLLLSTISGVMGWIAYIYCVESLQEHPQNTGREASG